MYIYAYGTSNKVMDEWETYWSVNLSYLKSYHYFVCNKETD